MSPKLNFLTTALLTSFLLGNAVPIATATATLPATTVETIVEPAPPAPIEAAAPAPQLEVPAATETAPPTAAPAPFSVDAAEAFIDKTPDYNLGATQPTPSTYEPPSEIVIIPGTAAASPTPTAVAPVQVGAVHLSSAGISWNSDPGESVNHDASAGSSAAAANSYSTASPGLPYLNPTLVKTFARMGNDNLRLLFPVAIPAPITSLFGWRIHPLSGSQRMHTGTDIGAPMGAPVLAALAGRVILADAMGGYGMSVAIEHENGTRQTMYAHMSELFVKPGEMVQQGAVIGRVGSTGASTGPHLHFEFRQMMPDGTWVALDSGQHLEVAMGDLVKSLQIAQQPKPAIAQKPKVQNGQ
jgi:murein DD-endopeptidase MepM/ murein hydrolase activator NlpD